MNICILPRGTWYCHRLSSAYWIFEIMLRTFEVCKERKCPRISWSEDFVFWMRYHNMLMECTGNIMSVYHQNGEIKKIRKKILFFAGWMRKLCVKRGRRYLYCTVLVTILSSPSPSPLSLQHNRCPLYLPCPVMINDELSIWSERNTFNW